MNVIDLLHQLSKQSDSKIRQNACVFMNDDGIVLSDGYSKLFYESNEISPFNSALIKANLKKVSLSGSSVFCIGFPVRYDAQLLVEMKIQSLYFIDDSNDIEIGLKLLCNANVEVYQINIDTLATTRRLAIDTPEVENSPKFFGDTTEQQPEPTTNHEKKYFGQ